MLSALHAAGVEARRYYFPGLHRTRAFAACAAGPLPVTDDLASRIVCLPVYSIYDDGELEDLVTTVSAAAAATMAHSDGLSRR
jgi:dTDP-4-amino-4,6-dideoxygalactose transaminase